MGFATSWIGAGALAVAGAALAGGLQGSWRQGQGVERAQGREEVAADVLLPLASRDWWFRITDGEREGETVRLSLRPASGDGGGQAGGRGGGMWEYELDDLRTMYISRGAGGAVLLHMAVLRDQGYSLRYDPAVTLIPARVRAGSTVSDAGRVEVFNLDDGSRVGSGRVEHAVRSAGRSRVQTPAGTFDALMLRMEHTVDLDMADLRLTIWSGYQPGEGRVYQHHVSEVEKLGMFGDTTVQAMKLTRREGGAGENRGGGDRGGGDGGAWRGDGRRSQWVLMGGGGAQ